MPTITIDGRTIEAAPGTRLIDAAAAEGIEIPHFCYHPGLSVAGNCRMCEVEIEGARKLEPACNTLCRDGMVVHTESEKVRRTRAAVLELLLIHHPVDCPVCDQAGECKLQDYYMRHSLRGSRFDLEDKLQENKIVPLGNHIMLDNERCVNCTACVRFSEEISGEAEIGMFQRGDNSYIATFESTPLRSHYSGNLAEICPVGALTDADFRFLHRVWFLSSTDSVCDGCARGCSIQIHHDVDRTFKRSMVQRVFRYRARHNPHVNSYWLCDTGRYSYKKLDAPSRLLQPTDTGQEVEWSFAVQRLAAAIRESSGRIDVILVADRTCEEMQAIRQVLVEGVGVRTLVSTVPGLGCGEGDGFLQVADCTPNRRGAVELGLVPAEGSSPRARVQEVLERASQGETGLLLIFGADLTASDADEALVRKAVQGAETTVYSGSHANATSELADLVLPRAEFAEQDGTFVNLNGLIQRLHICFPALGHARPEWQWLAELGGLLGMEQVPQGAADWFAAATAASDFFAGLEFNTIPPLGTPGAGIENPTAPTPPGQRSTPLQEVTAS
jgi:NADH-quinone oxidoreductase subunit G